MGTSRARQVLGGRAADHRTQRWTTAEDPTTIIESGHPAEERHMSTTAEEHHISSTAEKHHTSTTEKGHAVEDGHLAEDGHPAEEGHSAEEGHKGGQLLHHWL